MGPNEYEFFEQAGSIVVKWMGPTFPIEITYIAVAFLAILPFLFFFRRPFARFADRHLHIHWSPNVFGILAPTLSLVCGVLLVFSKEPKGMIYWDLEPTGLSVKSPNGTAAMKWTEIDSAAFDERRPEKSTLVFKTKSGRELWLELSWLEPENQNTLLAFINRSTQNRFNLPGEISGSDEE